MFERSFHFVPAHRPEFFTRLYELGADAIVFDLEDAVPYDKKPEAISYLMEILGSAIFNVPCYVRVNGSDAPWTAAESHLLLEYPNLGIVLPKASGPLSVQHALREYRSNDARNLIILIEDFQALLHLGELARLESLTAIGLGLEDLYHSSRFNSSELKALTGRIRSELAIHCHANGIIGIDSISADLSAGSSLEQDTVDARAAGLDAKFSIHPNQIPVINRILSPSPEAVEAAMRLNDLNMVNADHSGYQVICGEIVSPPKLKKAQTIINFVTHHESNP